MYYVLSLAIGIALGLIVLKFFPVFVRQDMIQKKYLGYGENDPAKREKQLYKFLIGFAIVCVAISIYALFFM